MDRTNSESPVTRDESGEYPSISYAWYVVAVLTLAYMFSFLDRQIIVFLIDHIKRDFSLNNVQVGLLHGSTFALFYTLFGIPVGRWAGQSHQNHVNLNPMRKAGLTELLLTKSRILATRRASAQVSIASQ